MFNRISEHFDDSDDSFQASEAMTAERREALIEDEYVERMHVLLQGAAEYASRIIPENDSLAADINRVLAERLMNASDKMHHHELVIVGLAARAIEQLLSC